MLLTQKQKIALQYGIILVPYLLLLLAPYAPPVYWPVGSTFLAITAMAAAGIIHDAAPYSIHKMFWIFNLVFFGIVPTYQYRTGHMPWEQHFSQDIFLYANMVILAGFAAYMLARRLVKKRLPTMATLPEKQADKGFVNSYYFTGNIVYIFCCTALILIYGLDNLWLRRMADSAALQLNSTLFLLADKALRGAVMYFALLTVQLYRGKHIGLPQLVWVLAACIVVNFPLALPRYLVATLYLSLLIAAGLRIFRNRYFFAYALIALTLIVFPLWGMTRLYLHDATMQLSQISSVYTDAVSSGDFDAYTSLCRTITYVQAHGVSGGYQLLGVLLFFVPRSLWPSKPVGSGALVYDPIGVGFRNIASPFFAEGFINFGIVGTICFAALLAFVAARYDRFYQAYHHQEKAPLNYAFIFYPVAMVMVFFMLRGDLLSSFAYLCGFFVSGMAFHILLLRTRTKQV